MGALFQRWRSVILFLRIQLVLITLRARISDFKHQQNTTVRTYIHTAYASAIPATTS